MFVVVTGGSGSGKSAYAEQRILEFGQQKRYYIATMQCMDDESKQRIARHRAMRSGKEFETIECPTNLAAVCVQPGCTVLLECMSNLTANEFFDGGTHTPMEVCRKIMSGVRKLKTQCRHLVIVTNEVFSDCIPYDELTKQYIECLALINRAMAKEADQVVEVVYGLPIACK